MCKKCGSNRSHPVDRIRIEQNPPGQSGGCLRAIAVPAMGVSLVAFLLRRH